MQTKEEAWPKSGKTQVTSVASHQTEVVLIFHTSCSRGELHWCGRRITWQLVPCWFLPRPQLMSAGFISILTQYLKWITCVASDLHWKRSQAWKLAKGHAEHLWLMLSAPPAGPEGPPRTPLPCPHPSDGPRSLSAPCSSAVRQLSYGMSSFHSIIPISQQQQLNRNISMLANSLNSPCFPAAETPQLVGTMFPRRSVKFKIVWVEGWRLLLTC